MNILFYTTNEVAPQYGGVERVTANIANALTTFYNVNCFTLPINTTLTNPLLNSNSLIQLKSILITISII